MTRGLVVKPQFAPQLSSSHRRPEEPDVCLFSPGTFSRWTEKLARSSSTLTDSVKKRKQQKTLTNVWFLIEAFRVSRFLQAWLTNSSWKHYDGPKNKTGSLLHHLPDALCQQVRALIGLRLPNCPVINEWLCSVPSSLLILLYLFGFGVDAAGPNVNVWHFPVSLFSFGCISDAPRGHLRGGCTAGSQGEGVETFGQGRTSQRTS